MSSRVSYLDNASTAHPKPTVLADAIHRYITEIGASPSRANHALARAANTAVKGAVERIAATFGIRSHDQLAFTSNATHALNVILKGALRRGDHVITTALEHNAVLRPLEHMKRNGIIEYDVVSCDAAGRIRPETIQMLMRSTTKMVVVNHGSNVLGTLTDLAPISQLCADHKIALAVDAAQTAGFLDLDVDAMGVQYLAFTGHKKLLGPSGIGGAFIRDPLLVGGLMQGGTGGNSNSLVHPETHKFEVGTSNYLGIVGLAATIDHVMKMGLARIREHEVALTMDLIERLKRIPRVVVYGECEPERRLPIVSFSIQGLLPGDIGYVLDSVFGIMVRTGVHCAPLVHQAIGTFPHGTVRISLGPSTEQLDIDRVVDAVANIASGKRRRTPTHELRRKL